MSEGATRLLGPWQLAITEAGACGQPSGVADFTAAAQVPGTVAASLAAAGLWAEGTPLRLHHRDVWYLAPILQSGRFRLRLAGLATLAEVFVGERRVLVTGNAFRSYQLDVEVSAGERLAVVLRALEAALAAKAPRARWRAPMIADQRLRLLRTPLLGQMPGWTPAVDVVGPTRALALEAIPEVEIVGLSSRLDGDDGVVAMAIRGQAGAAARLIVGGRAADFRADGGLFTAALTLPAVERWWPHTHGRPALHDVALEIGGVRRAAGQVGFRTIERRDGNGFGLIVNGVPVFCRGAVFTEADPVGLCASRETYAPWLTLARKAGMNMIRVPGTMVPPGRAFFDLCDELGLMAWLDFPFANFDYPIADPAFRAEVAAEADDLLAMIGPAPSLAVLCGGSEAQQQAAMMGLAPERWPGPLFDEVLAGAARRRRPDVPYVVNSPSGGELPFSIPAGVSHYYGVGAYLRPLDDLRRAEVGFAGECLAFSNVPDARSLEADLPAVAAHEPRWKAGVPRDGAASWDFEDVREHYLAELFDVDPRLLRREDPALWFDLSRVVTGLVMAEAFAEWRRGRSPTRGALVYTLMDMAPGAGFGVIDQRGRPKPAWHFLKRVLKPVQVLLTEEGGEGLAIHLVNETGAAVAGRLELTCLRDGRAAVLRRSREVTLAPRSTEEISAYALIGSFFDIGYAYRFGPPGHDVTVVRLVATDDGRLLSEATHHPLGLARRWPAPGVAVAVETSDDGPALVIESDGYAPFVHLALENHRPDDDWFALIPGTRRRIGLCGDGPLAGSLSLPGGRILAGFGAPTSDRLR